MCNIQAVFALILVGELLGVALVVNDRGLERFDWPQLGMVSFLIQWIVLTSAACLCPLRNWFKNQHSAVAGTVSYGIVLILTVIFSAIGQWIVTRSAQLALSPILNNLIIAAVFAGVVLRYFYLQAQLQNQQKSELQSRIQALQSRIRPHFLFNSMNSIASLIEIEPKTAEKMVVDLAFLFRASLSETELVPLEKEVDLCRKYVAIEQQRLGDRLRVDWRIGEFPSECTVPSLLIQPLIENAIFHGVQPLTEGGDVTISVQVVDKETNITVVNPAPDTELSAERKNGMALENIRHRLQAYYGTAGSIMTSLSEQKFAVNVRYPSVAPESTT